jgi:hypothetical protein
MQQPAEHAEHDCRHEHENHDGKDKRHPQRQEQVIASAEKVP